MKRRSTIAVLSRRFRRMPTTMLLIGGLLLVLTWYVLATSAYVSMQYAISDHAEQQEVLLADIEKLETQVADVSRPEALEARAAALGFVAVSSPTYLSVPGDAVARR